MFIAAAPQRTKNIRFGTGVVSLPQHHPWLLADRLVMLDHLTRGRFIFGASPGALATDAYIMGIDPVEQMTGATLRPSPRRASMAPPRRRRIRRHGRARCPRRGRVSLGDRAQSLRGSLRGRRASNLASTSTVASVP